MRKPIDWFAQKDARAMLTFLRGDNLRRGDRVRFLVALYGVFALMAVLGAAQAGVTQYVPPLVPSSSPSQQVIDARQTDAAAAHEARLDAIDRLRIDARMSVLESAVESLTWAGRTNYVVAITLLLNLVATVYQLRQGKDRRADERRQRDTYDS